MPWPVPNPVPWDGNPGSERGQERGAGCVELRGTVLANPSSCRPREPEGVPGQGCLPPALCSQRGLAEGSHAAFPEPCQPARFAAWPAPSKAVTAQIWPPHSPVAPGRLTASCSQPRRAALSLPSLALTHFFLSLFSQPAHRTLISSPESSFPKTCSAASFSKPISRGFCTALGTRVTTWQESLLPYIFMPHRCPQTPSRSQGRVRRRQLGRSHGA